MKPLVIYHANCTDGFGAAFAAWLKLGDEAEYLPMNYNQPTDEIIWQDREVYILDFSFDRDTMTAMMGGQECAKRVVWLDHHKTAFEMWCGKYEKGMLFFNDAAPHYILLDDTKSGALLAWEYFHPGTEVPMLIRHIDDRDRWQFKLEGTKELHAALRSMEPWSFEQWEHVLDCEQGSRTGLMDYYIQGAAILRAQDAHVKYMAGNARKCLITVPVEDEETYEVNEYKPGLAVNAPIHQSEIGHELANASGTFGLVWYLGDSGGVRCSLRSNGDYDVSAIARSFGGGGHRNAAGFEVDVHTLMGWLK